MIEPAATTVVRNPVSDVEKLSSILDSGSGVDLWVNSKYLFGVVIGAIDMKYIIPSFCFVKS